MISVSKLYTDRSQAHDGLRYGVRSAGDVEKPHAVQASARRRRPVVVWNITRTCNLRCVHCYTDSEERKYEGELAKDDVQKRDAAEGHPKGQGMLEPHIRHAHGLKEGLQPMGQKWFPQPPQTQAGQSDPQLGG